MTVPWRKIKSEIESLSSVVVACSGGVDSRFLLDFVSKSKVNFVVAYFDHDLGNGNCNFVRNLADMYQSKFFVGKGINIGSSISLEADAHMQRTDFLKKIKSECACNKILTGHNLTDNVETILIKLIRGHPHSSLGLEKSNDYFFRPFLEVSKNQLTSQARHLKLEWLEDESNKDSSIGDRNFLRNEIIPKLMSINNIEKSFVKGLNL